MRGARRSSPIAMAQREGPQPDEHHGRGRVVAQDIAARAAVEADHERHRERHGEHHVADARDQVGAPALVDAQQRVGDLEVGEGPQAEHAVGHEGRVARAQQRPREDAGEDDRHERGDGARDEHEGRRAAGQAIAVHDIVVVEVEAHEGLAHAEAQDDADQDDRREQGLGVAELRLGQVVGVEREGEEGEEPRDQARRLVGEPRRREALEVALHGPGRYPVRRCSPGCCH